MGRVFLSQADATEYAPKAGETLHHIVAHNCEKADPPITCDEVALFNWGTGETPEVLRALVELVGCRKIDPDPYQCELDPAKGLKGKLYLPKVWKKKDLAYEKLHKVVVKQQLPATAVSIASLDPWFLPGEQACSISYTLEGIKDRAKLLDFDVYASNYCKATATVKGDFVDYAYADTPDVPILQKTVNADAPERGSSGIGDWKGESEAASGVLAKRAGKTRFINAASSPYTVVLRYAKDDSHKTAFVNLHSFWPRWSGSDGARALVADSLKIKWTAKNCPGGLQGQIQVFDKDGMVWHQFLPASKTGNGDQEYDWADGTAMVAEDKMPYRVQVQLHTDKDTDDGFGIAAMHTEVRLFTHPQIGTFDPDHEQEPQVLEFALAPYYAGPAPPEDSAKGRKLRLARAGYHPGPVADGEGQDAYIQAVSEFQRDHAKPGVNPAERLKADGTIDALTKTAVKAQAPGRRALFAKVDRSDLTADGDIKSALNDKATQTILWVDDRHSYTAVTASSAPYLLPNMGLEDYHGSMGADGDIKQDKDDDATCRPWIPVEVSVPVMRTEDTLTGVTVPAINDASRAAAGPIRIDWTFRDLAVEDKIDTAQYQASRGRPRKYLTDTFAGIKGAHNGKDAWNCTDALGGIRGADYYQAPFGVDDDSLMPWKALADSGVSAVCSVAHDDLGQDAAQVFAPYLGKAGVYFHPSIIAGDGYQFRAQVSFRDLPSGSTHPNWKVLRDRYDATKLAQAHSAPLRLWRKDSLRAYVPWAPPGELTWGANDVAFIKFYEPAMVHFEYEGGASTTIALNALLPVPNDYLNTVDTNITGKKGTNAKTDRYRPKAEMVFSAQYLWPWSTAVHLGIQAVPDPAIGVADYESTYLNNDIYGDSWYTYAPPLIHLLMARVERNKGLLRGHLVSEFRSSPQYWKETYVCGKCGANEILLELTAAGGSGVGEDCRVAACSGKLLSSVNETYTCDVCNFARTASVSLNLEGTACTQRCTGVLALVSSTPNSNWVGRLLGMDGCTSTYGCGTCRRQTVISETTSTKGNRAGAVCGAACAGHMRGNAATRTNQNIIGPQRNLNLPAVGEPLGALWLMTTGGPRTFWAHEVGHHKHLEHAGDVIARPKQHDHTSNTVDPAVQAAPVGSDMWDRVCIMSYINTEAGPDAAYFCGKCILKLRGWKVEGLADPASGVTGP